MYVGIFGDVIFSVGHLRTLTLSNFKGTSGAKWVDHEVIGGKAKSEYIAPKLMEYTCDILLDADHGVNPRKDAESVEADDGKRRSPLFHHRFCPIVKKQVHHYQHERQLGCCDKAWPAGAV